MTATFIAAADLKAALGISDSTKDTLLQSMCDGVESLWEEKTGRNWTEAERTQYYDSPGYNSQVQLKDHPVKSSASFSIWDDPDWDWESTSLITSSNYRVDYDNGIVYYNGFFYEGKQSIKVTYTAGYTVANVPPWLKRILIRQACHWYKQESDQRWDKSSVAAPSGGGTVAYKNMRDNLLPEFVKAVEDNID